MLTIPNLLSLLRLLMVPVFILASIRGKYLLALVVFLSAAGTDILDGWIARRFNQRSRFGAILDPAADKTMMISGYVYFTFSTHLDARLPGWLTFVVFIRDFLIVIVAYLLYTRIHVKKFPPSIAGKLSTMLQATALAFTIAVNGPLPNLRPYLDLVFRVALVITLFSGWGYLRRGRTLIADELREA